MNALVHFLNKFLTTLANHIGSEKLSQQLKKFPSTYDSMLNFLGLNRNSHAYTVYVLCPKCNLVYNKDDCIENVCGQEQSRKCVYVRFPKHPHKRLREPCHTSLLKENLKADNTVSLVPRKVYPYCSLRESIQRIASQRNFLQKCEHWRRRSVPPDVMGDIYDGDIWKIFMSDDYGNFLQQPGNLLLAINCDWFQPFANTQYSVGAIYLTILNLPRQERYRLENIILVSIIPGPKEPKLTLNPLLAPFVEELNSAYSGWPITVNDDLLGDNVTFYIRLCIGCVTCDIPAMRKICGFLGHSAKLGCSKCLKQFPKNAFGDKSDYSGFELDQWTPRLLTRHKRQCEKLNKCKTLTKLKTKQSKYGIRYSLLLDLPHFDPIRFGIVDPMHNLLLGTPKHMFSLWIDRNKISQSNLSLIQTTCEKFSIPHDVGRIPTKIGSNFSGFTADQWRMWTTVLSVVSLKGILPEPDYRCWVLYANACRILCSRIITTSNIQTAHGFLTLFCKKVEEIYGKSACTINLHLHLHLQQCLVDYGPVHGMWCFAFERFNGVLGAYHTNNKNIEEQIVKKFLSHQKIKSLSQEEFFSEFKEFFSDNSKGSLKENDDPCSTLKLMELAKVRHFGSCSFKLDGSSSDIHFISCGTEIVMSPVDTQNLKLIYEQLYPQRLIIHFSQFARKFNCISVGTEVIRNTKKSGVVMAYWPSSGTSLMSVNYTRYSVGIIDKFVKHHIKFEDGEEDHLFCYVKWKESHPLFDWFGQLATVSCNTNAIENACCFMPVQRIAYRCASAELNVDFGSVTDVVFVACPINLKYYL